MLWSVWPAPLSGVAVRRQFKRVSSLQVHETSLPIVSAGQMTSMAASRCNCAYGHVGAMCPAAVGICRAVVLVTSSKTLPIAVTVLSQLVSHARVWHRPSSGSLCRCTSDPDHLGLTLGLLLGP